MEEVDTKTQREMESRLQEALADFRRQNEVQTQIHREEMESLYEAKVWVHTRAILCRQRSYPL